MHIRSLLVCLLLLVFAGSAAWGAGWFDMGKFYSDNGKKALQDCHYIEAAHWFEKAEKLATKDVRLDAGLLELIGYSYMKAHEYEKAVYNLQMANHQYDMVVFMNPEAARVYDCLAQVRIDMKDYAIAESLLLEAYDRTMGPDPAKVYDAKRVAERAARLAYICSLEGGLSPSGQYKGTRNRGRTSDDMFAYAVRDLLERERKSGRPQPEIQQAVTAVFAGWKKLIDIGGSAENRASYNRCWEQAYGSKPAGTVISSAGSSATTILPWPKPAPGGGLPSWGFNGGAGGGGGGHVFPWAPKTGGTGTLWTGGAGTAGTGAGLTPRPIGAGGGTGSAAHIYISPFARPSVSRSSFLVGQSELLFGENKSYEGEALKTLDENLKRLGY
jgi:hypothetical protein